MIRTATSRFRCGRRPASNFPACPFPGQNGKVVFVSSRTTGPGVDNPTGDGEIFTAYPDGTNLTQLTFNTANDLDPTYSPDGKRIAFETNRDGNFEIYKMRAADGASRISVSRNPASDLTPAYSPNGEWIAFSSNRNGNYEVYKMTASGFRQANVSNNLASDLGPDRQPLQPLR